MMDSRTMLVAMAILAIVMAAAITLANVRDGRMRAMTLWAWAYFAIFIGLALYGLRGAIPEALSSVGGFAAASAGAMLMVAALVEFYGRRVSWRIMAGLVLAGVAAHAAIFFIFTDSGRWRLAFTSYVMGAWLVAAALTLFRRAARHEREPHWMTGSFFSLWAAAFAARALYATFVADPTMTLLGTNAVQSAWLIVQFAALAGTSLGFVLMTKERSDYKIRQMASTDVLTGLLNRRAFDEAAMVELNRAAREGRSACVLLLDLDHFKNVNDTHGHPAGDVVLQRFAAVMRAHLRPFDLAARYGGEEFCVLLGGATLSEAIDIAERIRMTSTQQPVTVDGKPIIYSVSIGIAQAASPGASLGDIVAQADRALYRAKSDGRNRVFPAPVVPLR